MARRVLGNDPFKTGAANRGTTGPSSAPAPAPAAPIARPPAPAKPAPAPQVSAPLRKAAEKRVVKSAVPASPAKHRAAQKPPYEPHPASPEAVAIFGSEPLSHPGSPSVGVDPIPHAHSPDGSRILPLHPEPVPAPALSPKAHADSPLGTALPPFPAISPKAHPGSPVGKALPAAHPDSPQGSPLPPFPAISPKAHPGSPVGKPLPVPHVDSPLGSPLPPFPAISPKAHPGSPVGKPLPVPHVDSPLGSPLPPFPAISPKAHPGSPVAKPLPVPHAASPEAKAVPTAHVGSPELRELPKPHAGSPEARELPKPHAASPEARPLPKPHADSPEARELPRPHAASPEAKPLPKPHAGSPEAKPLPIPHAASPEAKPLPKPHAGSPEAKPLPVAHAESPRIGADPTPHAASPLGREVLPPEPEPGEPELPLPDEFTPQQHLPRTPRGQTFALAKTLLESSVSLPVWGAAKGLFQAARSAMGMGALGDLDAWGKDVALTAQLEPLASFLFDRYWRVNVTGAELIPRGPSLIVANHSGALPLDGPMLRYALERSRADLPPARWLVEDQLFHTPFFGLLSARLGAVRANPENALRLLAEGQSVIVFPEGIHGLSRPFAERYQLRRFGRGGFVKLAIRAGVPIVPAALVGADESMPLLGTLPGGVFGLPHLPLTTPPLPARWFLRFGKPIDLKKAPANAEEDLAFVQRENERTRDVIAGMLSAMLAQRDSIF